MKAVIYGKPICGFCNKAEKLCKNNNIEYDYKIVGEDEDITIDELIELVGKPIKTVPQIFLFHGDEREYIGGFTELKEKLKDFS